MTSVHPLAVALVAVGHGLSFGLPSGWQVTHRTFTPCVDPVERVTVFRGDAAIMLQERLHPDPSELRGRPAHFTVQGRPGPLECCSIGNRKGWSIEFSEHGRAFYADVYPGQRRATDPLRVLDSVRIAEDPGRLRAPGPPRARGAGPRGRAAVPRLAAGA